MWRSRSVTAARLRQNTATAPPRAAPRISISLLVASVAALRTARPAAVVAANRSSGAIIAVLRPADVRGAPRSVPTTKVPREEAEAQHGCQRAEGPGLHGLDEGV